MHPKRSLSLAAVVLAAFAILIATAGAARGPQTAHQLRFATPAAVITYLKAHGISTRGIVVQRGARNYAGPRCPGKHWNCTKARRVIQFSTADTTNLFACSPSYGTPAGPAPTPTSSPPNCVIVQVNANGNNNAKCVETTTANPASLHCRVWQENVNGGNSATTFQLITQRNGQMQNASADSNVHQDNKFGQNNAIVTQTVVQNTFTSSSPVGQDQNVGTPPSLTPGLTSTIEQNGDPGNTGSTQFALMSQAVVQLASAGKRRDEDDHGSISSYTAPTVFTGHQNQYADGTGDVEQHSGGVSKSFNFQNMIQKETAPWNATVAQSEIGPFRCCTFQGSNADDVFSIQQSKTQLTSSSAANLFLDQLGQLDTTGHGHIGQFANQNGTTQPNSCDVTNGGCEAEQTCESTSEGPPCMTPVSCSTDSEECCPSFECVLTFAHASANSSPQGELPMRTSSRITRFKHHF